MSSQKCQKCGEISEYDVKYEWCKPCQINDLKNHFTNWTSGSEKIDAVIQDMQLKINTPWDVVFEWIPYNQFNDIKGGFANIYSAIWKDGPLSYDCKKKEQARDINKRVNLKYLYNSQDTITNN